jgi:hypothetical protein
MKKHHRAPLLCVCKLKCSVSESRKLSAQKKNLFSIKQKKESWLFNYLMNDRHYWGLDSPLSEKDVTNSDFTFILNERKKFRFSTRKIQIEYSSQTGIVKVTFRAEPIMKLPSNEGVIVRNTEYNILSERIPGNFKLKNDIINWFEKQGAQGYKINVNFGRDTDMFHNYCSWTETIGAPLAERIASEIYHESFSSKRYSEIRNFLKNYKSSQSLGTSTINTQVNSLRKDCELEETGEMITYDIGHRLFHKIEYELTFEPPQKSFTDVLLGIFVSRSIIKKVLASSMIHLAQRLLCTTKETSQS